MEHLDSYDGPWCVCKGKRDRDEFKSGERQGADS